MQVSCAAVRYVPLSRTHHICHHYWRNSSSSQRRNPPSITAFTRQFDAFLCLAPGQAQSHLHIKMSVRHIPFDTTCISPSSFAHPSTRLLFNCRMSSNSPFPIYLFLIQLLRALRQTAVPYAPNILRVARTSSFDHPHFILVRHMAFRALLLNAPSFAECTPSMCCHQTQSSIFRVPANLHQPVRACCLGDYLTRHARVLLIISPLASTLALIAFIVIVSERVVAPHLGRRRCLINSNLRHHAHVLILIKLRDSQW
jgi:hypothetical protein